MLELDQLVKKLANKALRHQVLERARQGRLNAEEFLELTRQRHVCAADFVPLLQTGMTLAAGAGDSELVGVLLRNWQDETGVDHHNQSQPEQAHSTWRQWYLEALGIADSPPAPLLPGTEIYHRLLKMLRDSGDPFVAAGSLLFLEYFIPREFEALRVNRDQLWPERFVAAPDDLPKIIATKQRASRYLDDHIHHDAAYHYPALLAVLTKYKSDPAARRCIGRGIEQGQLAKLAFYDSLTEAFR